MAATAVKALSRGACGQHIAAGAWPYARKFAATCVGGLAGGEDHLGHAGAQGAMMIDLGEAEIFKRQVFQALESIGSQPCALRLHVFEQRFNLQSDP